MSIEFLINFTPQETRVALVEQGDMGTQACRTPGDGPAHQPAADHDQVIGRHRTPASPRQDNAEVFAERLGMDAGELARLAEAGIV